MCAQEVYFLWFNQEFLQPSLFSCSGPYHVHTASATQLNGLSLRVSFNFCYLASLILTTSCEEEITLCWQKSVLHLRSWQSVSGKILKLIGNKTNVWCYVRLSGSCVVWTLNRYHPRKVDQICRTGYAR